MFNYKFLWLGLVLVGGQFSCAVGQVCPAPANIAQFSQFSRADANSNKINLSGLRILGRFENNISLSGDAEVQYNGIQFKADQIGFNQQTNLADANGNLVFQRDGLLVRGDKAAFNLTSQQGFIEQPNYSLSKNGLGDASRLEIKSKKNVIIFDGRYSTCQREANKEWQPDWYIQASKIDLDFANEVGVAKHGVLHFKTVPILYWPYLSFPLGDKRKTGLLTPVFGLDDVSGIKVTLPFYWNIAPNFDITTTTSALSKRGINLANEFRLLTANHEADLIANILPTDKLKGKKRWSLLFDHSGSLFKVFGSDVKLQTHLNKVSDHHYWKDAMFLDEVFRRRILNNHLKLSWQKQQFSTQLLWQRWQALKSSNDSLTAPFNVEPQFSVGYNSLPDSPWLIQAKWQFSRFTSKEIIQQQDKPNRQDNANRQVAFLSLGYNLQRPEYYLKSKVQLQHNRYNFQQATAQHGKTASFTSPNLLIDGGLIFDRELQFKNKTYYNVVEPRILYSHTSYHQQNHIPLYDTALTDFNFSSIFSQNNYSGYDRLESGRQLTVGFSSKYFDRQQSNQLIDLRLAQRMVFSDEDEHNISYGKLLLGAKLNISPVWSLSTAIQYDHSNRRSVNNNLQLQYYPQPNKNINIAYYRQNIINKRVELGWQWPIGQILGSDSSNWNSIGNLNYDLKNKKMSTATLGLEYHSCCWATRFGVEATAADRHINKKFVLQIELTGLK